MLLLTNLTDMPLPDIAREVGLPLHDAEARLQTATSQFSMAREVPTTGIRPLFEPLLDHVDDARWPRVTIVRRAGTARRRTHTAAGAVAVVTAVVLGGAAVTDAQGVKPSLESARASGVAAVRLGPGPDADTRRGPGRHHGGRSRRDRARRTWSASTRSWTGSRASGARSARVPRPGS